MWRELIDGVLGLLFPDHCAGCGQAGGLVCDTCRAALRPYPGVVRRMPETLAEVRVGYIYGGALRSAIHQLKYQRVRRVARPLAGLLAERLREALPRADAIVAVPLHHIRLAERGYNQAEELARELSRIWGIPLRMGLLRGRATASQATLDARGRAANMLGAFIWEGASPPPRLILVDDVLTTGATMGACAETLLLAGAEVICGVALARSRPELDEPLIHGQGLVNG